MKQIMQMNINSQLAGLEADQLAIYKRAKELNKGLARKNLSLVFRAGLEAATSGFQLLRLNYSATIKIGFIFHRGIGDLV